ncbi:MAG: glutathione S-transferase family protein [Betaproteobacteria bacterium]
MLVIWGRDNSVNVQKVLWCCEEIGLDYERIDAGGPFGVINTPEYRALNPNGLVPTMDDDGFILWESNAIVRYLAASRAPGTLLPDDAIVRALAGQWMDWMTSTYWPAIRPLFLGLIRTAADKRDPVALEAARVKTAELMEMLDARLQSNTYLAGDVFTAGDISVGCGVWRWMALPIERAELPNVRRWFDLLSERPSFKKIVMHPLT